MLTVSARIRHRLYRLLQGYAESRYYPLVTGVVALLCAVGFVPFVPVLLVAVLLSSRQWWSIALFTSLGSAAGGLIVLMIFHHLGWIQVMNAHPEWFEGEVWLWMIAWLSDYGLWALAMIAATPFPQSPALLFLAMTEQSWWFIWLALAGGKLIKYGGTAFLVRYFPSRLGWLRRRVGL